MSTIEPAAINLAVATLLGAAIGFERQWRQRMAGLRTNTLVAIGAASFVIFEGLIPGEASPTRVAAQVVSGIGFLGAGIIFREGLNVTGLNTAATLWCSAAVGVLAGSGNPAHAALAAAFVVLVNLCLRPLVRLINRQPIVQTEVDVQYEVRVVCRNPDEAHVRALLLQAAGTSLLSLRRLKSADVEDTGRVEVTAHLTAHGRSDTLLEQIVGRLSLEPTVSAASWTAEPVAE
jgi:putative Mg2+ transporter-C (MgtC) family protein